MTANLCRKTCPMHCCVCCSSQQDYCSISITSSTQFRWHFHDGNLAKNNFPIPIVPVNLYYTFRCFERLFFHPFLPLVCPANCTDCNDDGNCTICDIGFYVDMQNGHICTGKL